MTIQNTTIRKAGPSQGNGVNVSFPFTFKVFASADVLVTYLDAIGTESSLVLSTDYTVALNADQNIAPGGTVTLLWTPASSTYITLTSQVSYTQNLALTNAGGFYPTSINDALDRIVIQVQQLAEFVSRCAKAPLSGIGSLSASSLVFGVDIYGIPVLSQLASISSTAVSTFMNTLLGLTSASAVKTALSVQSDLQTQANTAALTTGTSTAYVAAPSPTIATPTANTRLRVKFHLASGVTPTLTVGSVTANLQQYDATGALVTAKLGLNQLTDVEYNGTVFVVLDPLIVAVLPGTIIAFASATVPAGYLACPTAASTQPITTYPALAAAIGTSWGGDGTTTFGVPFFAEGQVPVAKGTGTVGANTAGAVISHTHGYNAVGSGSPQIDGYDAAALRYQISVANTTSATGGAANLPAGNRVQYCVKY